MNILIGAVLVLAQDLEQVVGLTRFIITHVHPDDTGLVFLVPVDEKHLDGSLKAAARYDIHIPPWGVARLGAGTWLRATPLLEKSFVECKLREDEIEEIRETLAYIASGRASEVKDDLEFVDPDEELELNEVEIQLLVDMGEEAAEIAYQPVLEAVHRLDEAFGI
jgi:hypothetical protein